MLHQDVWQPTKSLGTRKIGGSPSAICIGEQRIRIYARDIDDGLIELSGSQDGWEKNLDNIKDSPSAMLVGPQGPKVHGIRVYAHDATSAMMEEADTGHGWEPEARNLGQGHCQAVGW
jgi:hypothetical protein